MIQQFYFWYSSKENKNPNQKRYTHPVFIAALFTIAKLWMQPKCSSKEEWIKNMWPIYLSIYPQWNSIQPWKIMKY